MRPPSQKIIGIALLLCGGAVLLSGMWIPAKALVAQLLLDRAFSASVESGAPHTPWPRAEASTIARLTLPSGDTYIVLDQDHGRALAFGPGLVGGSVLPDQNAATGSHIIIAAHRDTQFQELGNLTMGDLVRITLVTGQDMTFTVDGSVVRDKDQADFVMDDQHRISLVTCWPLDALQPGGDDRLIISGRYDPQILTN